MNIRPALPGDEPEVARLLRHLHPDQETPFSLREVRQGARSFVATEGEAVVGFALASFVDYGISSYGTIEELVVDPTRRGCGHGAALVNACRDWLREEGIQVLFVSALDSAAEASYQRCGFTRCTGPWLYWAPEGEP